MQSNEGSSDQELFKKQSIEGSSDHELFKKQSIEGSSDHELFKKQSIEGSSDKQPNKESSGQILQSSNCSSSSESDRPFMTYGKEEQENRSLLPNLPEFFNPMPLPAAGYYGSIPSTMTSACASADNASFKSPYLIRPNAAIPCLLPHPSIRLIPGIVRPQPMSLVTGPGVMGTGLYGPHPNFNAAYSQQQRPPFFAYPSTIAPIPVSPYFTEVHATSSGDSTPFLTNRTAPSATATTTSSILTGTNSGHPPTAIEAEGKKVAFLEEENYVLDLSLRKRDSSSTAATTSSAVVETASGRPPTNKEAEGKKVVLLEKKNYVVDLSYRKMASSSTAATTSSVVVETGSGHSPTIQEAEGSKDATPESKESSITSSSSWSTRKRGQQLSAEEAKERYFEKRRKNNASAKRSRDNKREMVNDMVKKVERLEEENKKLEKAVADEQQLSKVLQQKMMLRNKKDGNLSFDKERL